MSAAKLVVIGDQFDDEGCTWEVVRQLPARTPTSPRIFECVVVQGQLAGGSNFAYSEAEIARARAASGHGPSPVDDGGPAFPVNELNQQTGSVHIQHMGVSLRDYFAAKAMQSIYVRFGGTGYPHSDHDGGLFHAAEAAYNMADAMLRARAKGGAA